MTRWLAVQLGHGALPDGTRLFSEAQSREMWNPQVIQPISPFPEPLSAATPMFSAYALGWEIEEYRGAKLIWHGGAVFGSLAAVVLLPDRNVGFYIAVNAEEGQMVRGLMYELLDHYRPAPGHGRESAAFKQPAAPRSPLQAPATGRPGRPVAGDRRYAGDFADPGTHDQHPEQDGKLHVASCTAG